jgi:hypothetical protein
MSSQAKELAKDPVTDLAAKIYMELICRNVVVTESAAQIKSNPENLAKISFKLAEAFQRVSAALKQDSGPKNQTFDVQDVDLASWNAPKT